MAEIYHQHSDDKAVQIIFSDIAVNSDNGNFSVYDYIKAQLTETYGINDSRHIEVSRNNDRPIQQAKQAFLFLGVLVLYYEYIVVAF